MPRTFPPLEGQRHPHQGLPSTFVEVSAGFTAGIVSTLAVHPFDVIKTRLQIDQSNTSMRPGGSFQIAYKILKKEGFRYGWYRGLTPNLVGNSTSWGMYFMWYANMKEMLQTMHGADHELTGTDYFAASSVAGVLTAVVTNPIWVVKTRMLSKARDAPDAYVTTYQGITDIAKTEGFKGFYRGLIPSLVGVSHGAIQFMAYEKLKIWRAKMLSSNIVAEPALQKVDHVKHPEIALAKPDDPASKKVEEKLHNFDFLALSAVSKIFAGCLTYPYQVIRTRLQLIEEPLGLRGVVRSIWTKEGVRGFYKGMGPNVIRVLPSTCVTFLVYENVKLYLPTAFESNEDDDDK